MKPEYIIVHHTATRMAPWQETINSVNSSHQSRGFPRAESGFYIGYHRMIDLDGYQLVCRKDTERGAHCSAQKMNTKSIGLGCIGNFTKDRPSPLMLEKLESVLKDLTNKHNIPIQNILSHGDVGNTACCGDYLATDLVLIKESLGVDSDTPLWKRMARRWAKDNDIISKFKESPFSEEQTYWLAEVLRKAKLK